MDDMTMLYQYQIDLEVRGQILFEKYLKLSAPIKHDSLVMGKESLALLMRDVGVLKLAEDDKAAVLQELELSDVDEDCLLNFAEFVTFTRYLCQRGSLNRNMLQIIHDEYEEARRKIVYRNYCDEPGKMFRRGLHRFLRALKVSKALNKFELTMIWTGSTVTKAAVGREEEFIPFSNFVSKTVPMTAAKVFAGHSKGTDHSITRKAIARLWRSVDDEYVNICKHAERQNVLVQLLPQEEKLIFRAFVGEESLVDLAELQTLLESVQDTDRGLGLAQLVEDIIQEECGDDPLVAFGDFLSVVPARFVTMLKTGCIIDLNEQRPMNVERSSMHPKDLEVLFKHFDVSSAGTIHFAQLEDMLTALHLRHKLKDLQSIIASNAGGGNATNQDLDIADLMAKVSGAQGGSGAETEEVDTAVDVEKTEDSQPTPEEGEVDQDNGSS